MLRYSNQSDRTEMATISPHTAYWWGDNGNYLNSFFRKVAMPYALSATDLSLPSSTKEHFGTRDGHIAQNAPFLSSVTARRLDFMSNVAHFWSDWDFVGAIDPRHAEQDKPVAHLGVSGNLEAGGITADPELFWNLTISSSPESVVPSSYGYTYEFWADSSALHDAVATGYFTSGSTATVLGTIKAIRFWRSDDRLYLMVCRYEKSGSEPSRHWLAAHITVADLSVLGAYPLNTEFAVNSCWVFPTMNYQPVFLDEYKDVFWDAYEDGGGREWFSTLSPYGHSLYYAYSYPLLCANRTTYGEIDDFLYGDHPYSFTSFRDQDVDAYLGGMYSLSHLSSRDAIESYFLAADSNLLEPIAEWREALSVVGLADLTQLVMKSTKGYKLLHMLDILTSAVLLYDFGIAPTIGDAEIIVDILKRPSDRLRKLLITPFTMRGSYTDTIELEGYELEIVVRSKIKAVLNPDSFLHYVLPLQSVGLLPSMSAIWDLIPFSFVFDKFFNTQEMLEAIDSSIIMLGFNVKSAWHSVKLIHEIDGDMLSDAGWSSEDGLRYSYYERFRTNMIPPMTPTNLVDPLDCSLPSFSTYGSLVYQLLK